MGAGRAGALNAAITSRRRPAPLDGVGPDDLGIDRLVARVAEGRIRELILAVNATVEGQTTAHYIMDRLAGLDVKVSRLAHGVPVGGELDISTKARCQRHPRAHTVLKGHFMDVRHQALDEIHDYWFSDLKAWDDHPEEQRRTDWFRPNRSHRFPHPRTRGGLDR